MEQFPRGDVWKDFVGGRDLCQAVCMEHKVLGGFGNTAGTSTLDLRRRYVRLHVAYSDVK